jgi:hypothetical protein
MMMLNQPDTLLLLLAGVALLLAGRRLFWLFVGVVGFLVGYRVSLQILGADARGMHWLIAVAAGLLGIVLALALQRMAVALAGFFVGGYAATVLFGLDLAKADLTSLLLFVLAGVIAAVLALRLFEGALIVLSALAGASLITEGLHLRHGTGTLLLAVLALLGVAVQAGLTSPGARRSSALRDRPRSG